MILHRKQITAIEEAPSATPFVTTRKRPVRPRFEPGDVIRLDPKAWLNKNRPLPELRGLGKIKVLGALGGPHGGAVIIKLKDGTNTVAAEDRFKVGAER